MENKKQFITLPAAIIIAGALIAMAILWNKKPAPAPIAENTKPEETQLAPVTAADHIFGNPNADIKIVEYSDPSCPFCKVFHIEMVKFMKEYGPEGKVAWVYRSFPLDKPNPDGFVLHPKAGKESEAMECAASLGGNEKFWQYTNKFYELTPSVTNNSPEGFDAKKLPEIASDIGLDVSAFNECLSGGKMKSKVDAQFTSGVNAGVEGTPTSFLVYKNQKPIPLQGALSYSDLKKVIEAVSEQP